VHGVPDFRADVARLVELYLEHAQLEEEVFLPLADAILTRNSNHMAALDIALHLRPRPAAARGLRLASQPTAFTNTAADRAAARCGSVRR
jgi:hypothetical protein